MLTKDQLTKLNKNASYNEALPICNKFILDFENHIKKLTEDGEPIGNYFENKIAIHGEPIISETVDSYLKDFFEQRGFTYNVVRTSFSHIERGLTIWLKITLRW